MSEIMITFAAVIELDRHIEILLLSNDCVIVPELGGFMAHHVDARYDADDRMFVPPLRTLGFNPQLKMNDSLLVQSYIEAYDISYPEALRRIESEVDELRAHLETEGEYELNDIGVLRLNREGNMEFEPCEAGILTPELYGLGTVAIDPLAVAEPKAASVKMATEETEAKASALPEEGTITIKMSWLRNAVAVAAALIAFLMIGTPVSNSNKMSGKQQSAFINMSPHRRPAAVSADVMAKPSVEEEAFEQVMPIENSVVDSNEPEPVVTEVSSAMRPLEKTPADSKSEPKPDVEKAQTTPAFALVLASQVSKRGAESFVRQLHGMGYGNARMVVSGSKKVRRVVYGSFKTEAEALGALGQLRGKSSLFRDSWVMKVK